MHESFSTQPTGGARHDRLADRRPDAAATVGSLLIADGHAGARLAPSLLRFMEGTALFSGLRPSELPALAPAIQEVQISRGDAIHRDEQDTPRVYVVVRGAMRVCVSCDGHDQRTVAIVGSHAVLSDSFSMMAGARWTQTLSAFQPSLLLSIRESDLTHIAHHDGRIAMNLATLLARRVLWLQRLTFLMASATPHQRVAACLIDLAEQHGHPTLDGGTVINLRLLQRDIADLVGVSRQVVSSTICAMRRDGVLVAKGQRIIVRDERRLWLAASPANPLASTSTAQRDHHGGTPGERIST